MEVETDHRAADREPPDEDAGNELVGGEPRERRVEGQQDGSIETGRGEQPQFAGLVGQLEHRRAGIEECAGMRCEADHGSRLAQRPCALKRDANHRAVAAMHAVEIAESSDCATEGAIGRLIAHDNEAVWRHRPSMGKKAFAP